MYTKVRRRRLTVKKKKLQYSIPDKVIQKNAGKTQNTEFLLNKQRLTAVTSLMAHSCSSLTFSTKNGVIPIEETWEKKNKTKKTGMNHHLVSTENFDSTNW